MKYFKILITPPPFSLEHGHCPAAEPRSKESSFLSVLKCALACFALVFFVLAGNAHAQTANCPHTPSDPPTDKDALIALYCATDGDNWTVSTNWDDPSSLLSTWQGVSTDADGRVISLILERNKLIGTIPDLSALTSLTRLYLAKNQLSGRIPDLSALTKLETLSLDDNQLNGRIPDLSALTNLKTLYLYNNQLNGRIPDLSALTKLETLFLYNNQLNGRIPDLSALTSLTRLQLDNNQLSGPIPDLSTLTELTYLYLYNNQLSGPIPDLSTLTELTYLYLYNNQLSGPIPDLSALTKLIHLQLYNNQLSGPIPDLSALTKLWLLYLNNNELTGPIPDLSALTSLSLLQLDDNQLSGEIPTSLGQRTSLTRLYLNGNELIGTIPTDLGDLTRLTRLKLNDNQLTGTIPTELGSLSNLQRLYLDNNQLRGTIPTELGELTSLIELYLDNNQLTGTIPDLSALTRLTRLQLNDNQLTGTIQIAELPSLETLETLHLDNNMLTGAIPLGALEDVAADSNRNFLELALWGNDGLSGAESISNELGKRVDRAVLSKLYGENGGSEWKSANDETLGSEEKWRPFFGQYVLSFGDWYGVDANSNGRVSGLDLSDNNLVGPITDALENLEDLEVLNLANNSDLTGELPLRLMDLPLLMTLDIRCTGVSTPADTNFEMWLSGINFQETCPPPPSPPPPPPPPPPSPPSPPESPDDTVLVIEENERFVISPMSEEGSITYNGETIEVTITRDENLSSESASPAIIVSPDLLDRVEEITFELFEYSPEAAPSGFRLEGFVADIDLVGVELGEGERVEVCLPAPEGGGESAALYRYDEGEEMWNRLESRVKTISGERLVCAETDALSLFGVFVAEEDDPGPSSPGRAEGSGGGGCAIASEKWTGNMLGSELLSLFLIVSFLLAVSQGSRSEARWM